MAQRSEIVEQFDKAIAKAQELLYMLYEAANQVHRILQGDEIIED